MLINEVLFNPPGSDAPNAYVELRGTPNYVLPSGTYFIAVNGDANGNPGSIENVFDLSGRALGGNGCLLLLEKTNLYAPSSNATVLVNTGGGDGFGSDGFSSVGHTGSGGRTDLKHASVTFFLVQSPVAPTPGHDIDANNDGTPDGPDYAAWIVLDSVGVLDNSADTAYGALNFRHDPAGLARGVIVPVNFTPSYVGRAGNSTDSSASAWVASDGLISSPPIWWLGPLTKTVPVSYSGKPLDHLGAPNFGAAPADGVVLIQPGWSVDVTEGGGADGYAVGLNTPPAGNVTVQLAAPNPLRFSLDAGLTWGTNGALAFSNTTPWNVLVRALQANVLDTSPRPVLVRHEITRSQDPAHYPVTALPALLRVNVRETNGLLLNELKVNPPGPTDAPDEFVELRGLPGLGLTNVYLLAVDGVATRAPGTLEWVINLSGAVLGSNGLLLVEAPNAPYAVAPDTGLFLDPRFSLPGGALPNESVSFLLVSCPAPLTQGADLDKGDNGSLEGLPFGTTLLDAVGWTGGDPNDIVYGGVNLPVLRSGTPDAATRYPGRDLPCDPNAWFYGKLVGPDGASLVYANDQAGPDFPYNTLLTPGAPNNTAPLITPVDPVCGAVGDPTNPQVVFRVADAEAGPAGVQVTAISSNPDVVPNGNLILTANGDGVHTLAINPVGEGYSLITLIASDGKMYSQSSFPYAASADSRGGGRFHTTASDGSAAFAVDGDYMFVGDDENEVLRLYPRDQSGPPVNRFDMTPFLDLWDADMGVWREVDLESCIRLNQRIYWLGSLSTSWQGTVRSNRSRVFATDLSGSGAQATLTYAGRYDGMKEDLLNWDANNLHGKGANYYGLVDSATQGVNSKLPDGAGLNIEGACLAPGSSNTAWLGFRAPLVPPTNRCRTLLIPITNFPAMAVAGPTNGVARFGPPIELNLGGRGVRDIGCRGTNVLIIAGPPGTGNLGYVPHDFKLFTWDGNPAHQPQQRDANLHGINPEGIVDLPAGPWTATNKIQLISDNGTFDFYGDGTEAKHLTITNFKKFRSDWVTLGPTVTPEPFVRPLWRQGSNCVLSWFSLEGLTYRVQFKTNLSQAVWTDLPGDLLATDGITRKPYTIVDPQPHFFRVKVVGGP